MEAECDKCKCWIHSGSRIHPGGLGQGLVGPWMTQKALANVRDTVVNIKGMTKPWDAWGWQSAEAAYTTRCRGEDVYTIPSEITLVQHIGMCLQLQSSEHRCKGLGQHRHGLCPHVQSNQRQYCYETGLLAGAAWKASPATKTKAERKVNPCVFTCTH